MRPSERKSLVFTRSSDDFRTLVDCVDAAWVQLSAHPRRRTRKGNPFRRLLDFPGSSRGGLERARALRMLRNQLIEVEGMLADYEKEHLNSISELQLIANRISEWREEEVSLDRLPLEGLWDLVRAAENLAIQREPEGSLRIRLSREISAAGSAETTTHATTTSRRPRLRHTLAGRFPRSLITRQVPSRRPRRPRISGRTPRGTADPKAATRTAGGRWRSPSCPSPSSAQWPGADRCTLLECWRPETGS
jgi:hypothetical protein